MENTAEEIMVAIEEVYLKSSLVNEQAKARLNVSTKVINKGLDSKPLKVHIRIIDVDESKEEIAKADARMVATEESLSAISMELTIEDPMRWSPDTPCLYKVIIEVTDHFDKVLIHEEHQHGFRDVKVEEGKLQINGTIAKIKESHLASYEDGFDFDPNRENYLAYMKHLKECNINAIWTGKELEDPLFYELCDQYGFYIFEQMHAEVGPDLIQRHRNHPSIIAWVIDEKGLKKNEALELRNKMITQDYDRPYIYREESLPKMTYIDQPFRIEWVSGQTDFIIESLVDYYPIEKTELWIIRTVDGEVIEEVNVKEFSIKESAEGAGKDKSVSNFKGSSDLLNWNGLDGSYTHVALEVRLAENVWWQKKGHVLASFSEVINIADYKNIPLEHSGYCKVEEKAEALVVKGQFGTIEVSKLSGFIEQIKLQGIDFLEAPVQPNFWMAGLDQSEGVDNDFYWMVKAFRKDPWEQAIGSIRVKTITHRMVGELAEISVEAKVKGLAGNLLMTYLISNQGECTITYEGTAARDLHRIGTCMTLALDCNQLNYFGEGPYGTIYSKAGATRCTVKSFDYSSDFLKGDPQTYKEVTWFTMNDQRSLGIMFEQFTPERLQVYTDGRKITVESIEPPDKGESFLYTVKCLLIYE